MKKIKGLMPFVTPDDVLPVKMFRMKPITTRVQAFRLGDWGPCEWCRGQTRCHRRWHGGHVHMVCSAMAANNPYLDDARPGPNRHDHKRAGTKAVRDQEIWRRLNQPVQFTPEAIADFKASMKAWAADVMVRR